jgi:HK97 family phage major capsid protein
VEAIQGEFAGKNYLFGTGAVVMNNTLPYTNKGGDTVTVPYFGTLGEMEDIGNEGDALTPEKLSMSKETATVMHSGKAFERTEWSRLAEAGDAYAEAARQFVIIAGRRVDKALIDVGTAALPSQYIHDVSAEGDGLLNYDKVVDATGAWGDQQERIVLLGIHSKVRRDLLKAKDTQGRYLYTLPTDTKDVERFMGIPVIVSDKCKKIDVGGGDFRYESLIVKEAAMAFWYQEEPRVLTGNDILADTEIVAIHMYWAVHRYLRVRGSTHSGIIKIVSK